MSNQFIYWLLIAISLPIAVLSLVELRKPDLGTRRHRWAVVSIGGSALTMAAAVILLLR